MPKISNFPLAITQSAKSVFATALAVGTITAGLLYVAPGDAQAGSRNLDVFIELNNGIDHRGKIAGEPRSRKHAGKRVSNRGSGKVRAHERVPEPVEVGHRRGRGYDYDRGYEGRYGARRGGGYRDRCHPRRAIRKAARKFGLRDPHIGRIGHRRIVVDGYKRGRFATVVFARNTPWCEVIRVRGGARW